MKFYINRIVFTLMFALIGCMAGHALTLEVMQDSVYTYAAVPDTSVPVQSYDWHVTGGTILNSPTGKSIRVKWTGADGSTGIVSVAAVGVSGCEGNFLQQSFTIRTSIPPGNPYAEISIDSIVNTAPKTTGNINGGNSAGFRIKIDSLRNIIVGATDTISLKYWVNDTISNDTITYYFAPGATSGNVLLSGKYYENMNFVSKNIEFTVLSNIYVNRALVFKTPELQPRSFKILGRPQVNKIRFK
jgi:hypothetical protein